MFNKIRETWRNFWDVDHNIREGLTPALRRYWDKLTRPIIRSKQVSLNLYCPYCLGTSNVIVTIEMERKEDEK